MLHFLSKIPAELLSNTLSVSVDKENVILESMWCHEFYRIAYEFLRKDTFVHSQVQKIGDKQIKGKVDFVLKNGGRLWVVEFLICGNTKASGMKITSEEEHVERFQGKYRSFSKYDYLVVDFRPGKGAKKELVNSSKYWRVYYSADTLELFRQDYKSIEFPLLNFHPSTSSGVKM